MDASSANRLITSYRQGNTSAQEYARGVEQAYLYGWLGIPAKEMSEIGSPALHLTPEQQQEAYAVGKKFAGRQIGTQQSQIRRSIIAADKSGKKTEGGVQYDGDTGKLSQRQQDNLAALGVLGKALGVRFVVFESATNEQGQHIGENGWYDPSDGSIHIDLYAGVKGDSVMLFTAAHELTHFIRDWSPAKFKVLANFLMQEYGKQGVSVNQLIEEQMAKAKRNGMELSYEEAFEEVIADSMEAMLSDGKVMEKLAKLKAQDQSLWEKLKEGITWLADKIRELYAGLKPDSKEGRYVAQMRDSIEQLQQLFTEGLQEASANYQAANGQKNTSKQETKSKFSHRTVDGNLVVWIENSQFTNKQLNDSSVISKYIKDHIGEVYTIIESGQKVYLGDDLPGEYTYSKYTDAIKKNAQPLYRAKNRASSYLGEIIEIATNRRWEKTKHPQNKDAKYGIYRYDSVFAFSVKDNAGNFTNVKAYNVELLIRNASDGKKYLYDIVEIKQNTTIQNALAKNEARAAAHRAAPGGSVSKENISQDSANVKKFSTRDPELQKANQLLEKENTKLREDVQELKELLKLQRTVTGGTKFTKTSLEAAARYLKSTVNAKGDTREFATILQDFYEYIATDGEITWESVSDMAQPAIQWLQEHTKQSRNDYAQDVLKHLRGSRISLDEQQKQEAAHAYGSYNDFRKSLMGSVTITENDAMSLDSYWHEWSQEYPYLFGADVSASDMPVALAEAVSTLRNALFNEVPVRGSNCIGHREGSGLVTLRGQTQQCKARYRVSFGANVAIPAGGTVAPITVALAIDGEAQGGATAIFTPAAAETFGYVGGDIYILVDRGCCVNVSVKNSGTAPITVSNLNLIAERIA